jgi:hypothetical protein
MSGDINCLKCGGTGFVDSGAMTSVIKSGDSFMKLSAPIQVRIPCPQCNLGKEKKDG